MKSYSDYLRLAKEKNVTFLEPRAPKGTRVTVSWRCNVTGVTVKRSFDSMQAKEYGSRYQEEYPKQLQMYLDLAERLGIEFVYDPNPNRINRKPDEYFPATTKTECYWRGRDGQIVKCAYRNLAYPTTSSRLIREKLGIPEEDWLLAVDVSI